MSMNTARNHISVCICTYKRPEMLAHLLRVLQNQKTGRQFTYSIVIVDNDHTQSAKTVVTSFKKKSVVDIDYYCESRQNIALARNKTVQNANGNYVAFIDDDEFPTDTWLVTLYETLLKYNVDGVLGPVRPRFECKPPRWVERGQFYSKPSDKTGVVLHWKDTRTSNVLLKRNILGASENIFDAAYGRGGEDTDLFKRLIEGGCVFVWCAEAYVYETVPPARCRRLFMLKRALLRGKVSLLDPSVGIFHIIKSLIAVSLYTGATPILCLAGHHILMRYLVKNFEHIGRLLAVCGIDVIKQNYVIK